MYEAAITIFVVLLLLIIGQALLTIGFCWVMRRGARAHEQLADSDCPSAAVILCLRGPDPFLPQCIERLFELDYPNFTLHIVIDHESDPARSIVEAAIASAEESARQAINPTIHYLQSPRSTCSLKCSSLVQVVEEIGESVDFIAQLDADTLTPKYWLRALATALQDEKVGAATGNRWYAPIQPSSGALVRYLWNAAAVVQMYWYNIAWGGTVAVKTKVIRECHLLDRWGNAFCEDTMLHSQLRKQGYRLAFSPTLMMVNYEDCDLAGYKRWGARQLLTARLYHPRWLAVVFHAVSTFVVPLVGLLFTLVAFAIGDIQAGQLSLAGLLVYEAITLLLLPLLEFSVRSRLRAEGEPITQSNTFGGWIRIILAVPLTQWVYTWVMCAAIRMRETEWRGVRYRIGGPWKIELEEYRPYSEAITETGDSKVSL